MNQEASFTLKELIEASGIAGRTIRYYISIGLLYPPLKSGRGACYGPEHIEKLKKIREFQRKGLTLSEIMYHLGARMESTVIPVAVKWDAIQLDDDLIIMIRSDSPPWKIKKLKQVMAELLPVINKKD